MILRIFKNALSSTLVIHFVLRQDCDHKWRIGKDVLQCKSMERSPPSEASSHSASHKIPRILWNPNIHYRVHNSPPRVLVLSQVNPVHNVLPYSPKIRCNITFPSIPRSSEWSLPFRFSNQNFSCISHLSCVLHALPYSYSLILSL
jgi:hypothetical protein